MINNNKNLIINKKKFTMNDQYNFSIFSGDKNPIHLDPIAARRTISGECIVHGINVLMWSINQLCNKTFFPINNFEAIFHKPILINKLIYLTWNADHKKIYITDNITIFTTIKVNINIDNPEIIKKPIPNKSKISIGLLQKYPKKNSILNCRFFKKTELLYRGDVNFGRLLFPSLFNCYGEDFAIELACTSEVVGMQIPGLNSLFLSIKGSVNNNKIDKHKYYELSKIDTRFNLLELNLQGIYFKYKIKAFCIPTFQNYKMEYFKKFVGSNEFLNVNALIIGGSRGLGEITAKIISSGSGKVTITYNIGKKEAIKIQKEISKYGNFCKIDKLDILDILKLPEGNFNQIYYFPTPKIQSDNNSKNNLKLLNTYRKYYVDSFKVLLDIFLIKNINIKIFYPSTIFINDDGNNFITYNKVKQEGEDLCIINNNIKDNKVKIIYERLPKMKTDQTISIHEKEFIDPIKILLPIIRRMSNELHI